MRVNGPFWAVGGVSAWCQATQVFNKIFMPLAKMRCRNDLF